MVYPTVAVIGTGFSGIGAAVLLQKKLNIHADIFESTKDVGGVWHRNTYPGCACDVPSHLYSFSFEPSPDWSQNYSKQEEIQAYLVHVAKKYDFYQSIQFETKVTRATWLEDRNQWEVEIQSKDNTRIAYYDILFSGIGMLRIPNIPKVFQSFEGKLMHSARWDHDYDLTDKKVAIVGSGSTAIQLIPNLQKRVSHLYSIQRTPAWVTKRDQFDFSSYTKFMFRWMPYLMRRYRNQLYRQAESTNKAFRNEHNDKDKPLTHKFKQDMEQVLASRGRSDLIDKLIPDIELGCKRVGVSSDYLPALCESNVTVIRAGASSVKGKTIIGDDGSETEVDVLCLATGFNVDGFLGEMQVYGREGVHLNKLWDEQPADTYKTVNVHGFPNFFMILGPNSIVSFNSAVAMAEIQVNHSIQAIEYMMKNKLSFVEPKLESQKEFSHDLQKSFEGSVYTSGCSSWYIGKHGNVQNIWSKGVDEFESVMEPFNENDFITE